MWFQEVGILLQYRELEERANTITTEIQCRRPLLSYERDEVLVGRNTGTDCEGIAEGDVVYSPGLPQALRIMETMLVTLIHYVVTTLIAKDGEFAGDSNQWQDLSTVNRNLRLQGAVHLRL
jgi:hypothetical protein